MFKFGTIRFRLWEKSDFEILHEWENDYDLFLFTRATPLIATTMTSIENEYNEMVKDPNTQKFMIEDVATNELIGGARIVVHSGDVRNAEIGVYIADPKNRNKGLGKLATVALLEMLFYHRNFEKIFAGSAEFNKRAHKTLLNCGFVKEGEWRKGIVLYGKYYSWYAFGILREEYYEIRDKLLKELLKEHYDEYVRMVSQLERV